MVRTAGFELVSLSKTAENYCFFGLSSITQIAASVPEIPSGTKAGPKRDHFFQLWKVLQSRANEARLHHQSALPKARPGRARDSEPQLRAPLGQPQQREPRARGRSASAEAITAAAAAWGWLCGCVAVSYSRFSFLLKNQSINKDTPKKSTLLTML